MRKKRKKIELTSSGASVFQMQDSYIADFLKVYVYICI